jgi:hypothetical protein
MVAKLRSFELARFMAVFGVDQKTVDRSLPDSVFQLAPTLHS